MNFTSSMRTSVRDISQPSLPADYESWTAIAKRDFLWNERISTTAYDPNDLPPLEKIDILGLMLTLMRIKMDRRADEAPKRWKKAIHARGSVAAVEYVPSSDSPFTGLFAGQASPGLIRLSVTRDPSDRPFAPGLALKLFVNGHPSENFSALVSLTGQGDNHNILANEFSNVVPVVNELGPRFINLLFRRTSKHPTKIFVEDLAKVDATGMSVEQPIFPEQLYLIPNSDIGFSDEKGRDFRTDLASLAPGTVLFTVHSVDSRDVGNSELNSSQRRERARPIGELRLTSRFVASAYGDSQLFFRHQRFRNQ